MKLLCLSHIKILRALSESAEPLNMTTLSKVANVSTANITGAMDRLERRGFVKRGHVGDDRRAVYAKITESGRDSLAESLKEISLAIA